MDMSHRPNRTQATITVNHHPVNVTVEGSGVDNPEQTLRDITAHVSAWRPSRSRRRSRERSAQPARAVQCAFARNGRHPMKQQIERNLGTDWCLPVQSLTRPHAGRFEALLQKREAEFALAAARLRLVDQCLGLLETHDDAAVAGYEVTPGGLTYADAALQCLLGGCVESLEMISRRVAERNESDRIAAAFGGYTRECTAAWIEQEAEDEKWALRRRQFVQAAVGGIDRGLRRSFHRPPHQRGYA